MKVKDLIGVLKGFHEDEIVKVNMNLFDCETKKSRSFDFFPKVTDVRDDVIIDYITAAIAKVIIDRSFPMADKNKEDG